MKKSATRQEIAARVEKLLERAAARLTSTTNHPERAQYRANFIEYSKFWRNAHMGALRTSTNKRNGRGHRIATVAEKRQLIEDLKQALLALAYVVDAPTEIDFERTIAIYDVLKRIKVRENGDLYLFR